MDKTMVKPPQFSEGKTGVAITPKGGNVLSLKDVSDTLDVERPTLMEWLASGYLMVEGQERIGTKMARWFREDYIWMIKKALPPPKERGMGKVILRPDVIKKIVAINKKFYPNR